MEKNTPIRLQEIIVGSSDPVINKKISKLERGGEIVKIAPRLYTSNLNEDPEKIIKRNLLQIIGQLFPGALLSHRSALEYAPTSTGQIFVTYKYTKNTKLPGVTIRFLEGEKAIEGDHVMFNGLSVSQLERAILENLQVSKKSGPDSKTLTYPEIEEKLEKIIRINGEDELNKVRDRAKEISNKIGMQKEFEKLNKIIGALLTTHPSKILKSPVATARAFGEPFDPARIEIFESLFKELQQGVYKILKEENTTDSSYKNFAFFESYFSNYIEGTEFGVEEAKNIIVTQTPIPTRDEDSHDVLGTYSIVSDVKEMNIIPKSSDDLLEILKYRHEVLLKARPSKKPGLFKDKNNRAGGTEFIDYNLVLGTLKRGFEYYNGLNQPFSKAAYMMFLISEIHPFPDGNGRVARIMMNAEFTASGQSKIIIPNVYRDDYLLSLRRLTRQMDPSPYIRMLSRAHEFSSKVIGEDIEEMQKYLESCNAFLNSDESTLRLR